MYLKFQNYDKNDKPVKGKYTFLNIFLALIYHPWEDEEHDRSNDTLKELLEKLKYQTEILFGADINAKIGIRYHEEYSNGIGPN